MAFPVIILGVVLPGGVIDFARSEKGLLKFPLKHCPHLVPRAVSRAVPQSDGVFDVPPRVANCKDDISRRVKLVSGEWRWGMLDEKTLAVVIPSEQNPRDISKERFVSLLEYCEEELGLEKVLAVFEKPGLSITEGFPRTLRYIGFRVLSPDSVPTPLSSENHFAMSYAI